jgi:hypothetical protein
MGDIYGLEGFVSELGLCQARFIYLKYFVPDKYLQFDLTNSNTICEISPF